MYRIALEVARRKWLTAVPSREEKKLVSGRQERSLLALYTLFCLSSMDCIHVLIFLTEKKISYMTIMTTARSSSNVLEVRSPKSVSLGYSQGVCRTHSLWNL